MGTQSTALLRTAARLYGFMTEKTLELDKASSVKLCKPGKLPATTCHYHHSPMLSHWLAAASCRNNEEPCDMLAAAWRTLTSQTQAYNQQAIPHIKHPKP